VLLAHVEDWDEPGAGYDRFWIDACDDDGNLSLGPDAQDDGALLDGGNIRVPHTPN
jgi:hypothetical protein